MTVLKENSNIKENYKNKIEGSLLLNQIKDESIKVCFFDPQYPRVLNKLNYGNEGKQEGKGRASLEQMDIEEIIYFISQMGRVIVPSGYLFLWVDKLHLDLAISSWGAAGNFNLVDMIAWDKGKSSKGYRTQRRAGYLIVLQKSPVKVKSTWTDRSIPDIWLERITNKEHPHQKPFGLQKSLIEATTNEGDYVLDPCAGSYSVFDACKATKRNFIGGDIKFGG